ncbi:amidophosphoribosyltransferase [Peptacetobacter hominis]|uniref:Amidophosphoribosyltransferase n=1 Tax=Peptacetobacter hominis TaxID=2743610 RepID=A0A544QT14_9FIRM|nr:amidophosphoribosyltransferase [Peptacetobacter hominis]TQQ83174.1 amidophosphoribosyltransferase [Peptacetobacter hominis]
MLDKLKEECGVFGIRTKGNDSAGMTHSALMALQHRGQEGAGIASLEGEHINIYKNRGLVSEVFSPEIIKELGDTEISIGHVRYSTTGSNSRENTQPIVAEYLKGRLAVAHNGNIVNSMEIREELEKEGCSFASTNDSESIAKLIGFEMLKENDELKAIEKAVNRLKGAFSLVIVTSGNRLVAVRDGWGFRPLCLGKGENGIAVASESCAFDSVNYEFIRDIEPGEMVIINEDLSVESKTVLEKDTKGSCIFEYVYFARTDSNIDGLSVYDARINMGRQLAREFKIDADIVCGVPDSGLEAAIGYAKESGIPYEFGFVKNRYIGRSFIFPSQEQREKAVKLKLNPLTSNLKGKRVILIDDSIVRGTTSAKLIKNVRRAGAKEVHMLVSSPMFKHTCYFGTDIDSEENLAANRMTLDEIRQSIGADSLGYISVEGLKKACSGCKRDFCTGCFDGNYPLKIKSYSKSQFEQKK